MRGMEEAGDPSYRAAAALACAPGVGKPARSPAGVAGGRCGRKATGLASGVGRAEREGRLARGVTRGRADVWAQAVSRGGGRVRRGSRPGVGCWRGRAGPRLGRDLGRGVASWDGFGGLGFFFNLFYFYSKINKV